MKLPHALAAEQVDAFRSAIGARLGLRVDDDRLLELDDLLLARLRSTGAHDVASYLDGPFRDPRESGELARALTVAETYFFRNGDQIAAFSAIAREHPPGSELRVLSAGCASGEEPYSLAIAAREANANVAISAFDANPEVLAKAMEGRYSAWSLRTTPDDLQKRYLPQRGAVYAIDPSVQAMVRFERRNLVDPDPSFWRPGAFDVIFCRNVLMYFVPAVAAEVVTRLRDALAPGGWLFLGHAETLRGLVQAATTPLHDLELTQLASAFAYRRKGGTRAPAAAHAVDAPTFTAPPLDDEWVASVARSSERIAALTSRPSVAAPPVASDPIVAPDDLLTRAVLLVEAGDFERARAACEAVLAADDLHAGAHYVLGLCREHEGDSAAGIARYRAAAYLDPTFAMPHLQLGLNARRARELAEARRELEVARALFSRETLARIERFGGGFGRDALIALCEGELARLGGAA